MNKNLKALTEYTQWIIWTISERDGKRIKLPISPHTFLPAKVTDPQDRGSYEQALHASQYMPDSGIGFVFTEHDPFFFLDIDKCRDELGNWSDLAINLCNGLCGAAVETSQSGTGLHVIGSAPFIPPHACKNRSLGIELYTQDRFVALTGNMLIPEGYAEYQTDITDLVNSYFPPKAYTNSAQWTAEPVEEYTLDVSDEELIEKAKASGSARSQFGGACSFKALWECDVEELSRHFPDDPYDASSADMALANHLSYWTGKNCERILSLMWKSGLVRDKWQRDDYLKRTISDAVSTVQSVYNVSKATSEEAQKYGGGDLVGKSDSQKDYAEQIRLSVLNNASDEQKEKLCQTSGPLSQARFWLDNKDKTPEQLLEISERAEERAGVQFMGVDQQREEYFNGFVYVVALNRVFCPEYGLLGKDQFNARYSCGYDFFVDFTGDRKPVRKAWDAFLSNSAYSAPVAAQTCFRPDLQTGAIIPINGVTCVNTYVPVVTPCIPGDASPFINHMTKLLPDARDREIFISYLAAIVQNPGKKFFWAPLLQGAEGNGKSLIVSCMTHIIGERYCHSPLPHELTSKFNSWLFGKVFIAIEEIKVNSEKLEVMEILKPIITDKRLACRAMQQDQTMSDNVANLLLVSNHQDALMLKVDNRRYAAFFCAQQSKEDIIRDGMTAQYFSQLYGWLDNHDGYSIVHHYLANYPIRDEFNPATLCGRAPTTTGTAQAIRTSRSPLEQLIIEAVESGELGFRGGWVSSSAIYSWFEQHGRKRSIPYQKLNGFMKELGYVLHPALMSGRTTRTVPGIIDNDKKIRLYVPSDSNLQTIRTEHEAIENYLNAQGQLQP